VNPPTTEAAILPPVNGGVVIPRSIVASIFGPVAVAVIVGASAWLVALQVNSSSQATKIDLLERQLLRIEGKLDSLSDSLRQQARP